MGPGSDGKEARLRQAGCPSRTASIRIGEDANRKVNFGADDAAPGRIELTQMGRAGQQSVAAFCADIWICLNHVVMVGMSVLSRTSSLLQADGHRRCWPELRQPSLSMRPMTLAHLLDATALGRSNRCSPVVLRNGGSAPAAVVLPNRKRWSRCYSRSQTTAGTPWTGSRTSVQRSFG